MFPFYNSQGRAQHGFSPCISCEVSEKTCGPYIPHFTKCHNFLCRETMPSPDSGPCREAETRVTSGPTSPPALGPLPILLKKPYALSVAPWPAEWVGVLGKGFGVQNLRSPGTPWLCTTESCLPPSLISCRVPLGLLSRIFSWIKFLEYVENNGIFVSLNS